MQYTICLYLPTSLIQAKNYRRLLDTFQINECDSIANPHLMCVNVDSN
ncbi:MAG: hypothetical protein HQK91_03985 [Nitrospirae bacterium]|nr:hypothetical protein [Nitrospirota bacterium]MBF0540597.1 hypothetical protein [Nitrospirota bacterium]